MYQVMLNTPKLGMTFVGDMWFCIRFRYSKVDGLE